MFFIQFKNLAICTVALKYNTRDALIDITDLNGPSKLQNIYLTLIVIVINKVFVKYLSSPI